MQERIGLIAGNGRFPFYFARSAKEKGIRIIAIGIKEETNRHLADVVEKIYWISIGDLVKLFAILTKERIDKVVMAGQIQHKVLFSDIEFDKAIQSLLTETRDHRTDTILGALVAKMQEQKIEVLPSILFLEDKLAPNGIITQRHPIEKEWEDIYFGKDIASAIAKIDIGQTVVVKDKVVLAIEAIEGTNKAIKRGAEWGGEGVVVIKMARPNQDMRFDVPVVGSDTLEICFQYKVSVLALQADKVLVLDRDKVLRIANRHNISIVGI